MRVEESLCAGGDRAVLRLILASRSKTLYVGVTNDMERRVWEHKTGYVEGFTKKYNICHLVYYEDYESIRDAIAREK